MAMTDANADMNLAMKDTFGDQENGAPIASLTAKYMPKLRRNPRTVAIVSPAKTGFPLVRMGGTEYIAPRNQPVMYNLNKRNGKNFKLDLFRGGKFKMMTCQMSSQLREKESKNAPIHACNASHMRRHLSNETYTSKGPTIPPVATVSHANLLDISPLATGKNGLFIISMSLS